MGFYHVLPAVQLVALALTGLSGRGPFPAGRRATFEVNRNSRSFPRQSFHSCSQSHISRGFQLGIQSVNADRDTIPSVLIGGYTPRNFSLTECGVLRGARACPPSRC